MRTVIWIGVALFLLGTTGLIGFHFGKDSATVVCDKAQTRNDQAIIDQGNHVIGQLKTVGDITQTAEGNYEKDQNSIGALYAPSVPIITPTPSVSAVRSLPKATCPPRTSKKYKLTPQQCDDEEAKCTELWNWAKSISVVK